MESSRKHSSIKNHRTTTKLNAAAGGPSLKREQRLPLKHHHHWSGLIRRETRLYLEHIKQTDFLRPLCQRRQEYKTLSGEQRKRSVIRFDIPRRRALMSHMIYDSSNDAIPGDPSVSHDFSRRSYLRLKLFPAIRNAIWRPREFQMKTSRIRTLTNCSQKPTTKAARSGENTSNTPFLCILSLSRRKSS